MTIKMAPKKAVLAVCVVAVLVTGGILYIKQARDAEILANVDRPETQSAEEKGADGSASPDANVAADSLAGAKIYVDVAGAVKNPGVVMIDVGSRVFQAIDAAGGGLKGADTRGLNLAAVINDGEHIYVPTEDEIASGNVPQNAANGSVSGGAVAGSASSGSENGKININTADSTALQQLNGVGPATAQKIIDYRNANGKFKATEELKNVSGIGDKTFEKMKDYICV
jgi:competence protein ComEA